MSSDIATAHCSVSASSLDNTVDELRIRPTFSLSLTHTHTHTHTDGTYFIVLLQFSFLMLQLTPSPPLQSLLQLHVLLGVFIEATNTFYEEQLVIPPSMIIHGLMVMCNISM